MIQSKNEYHRQSNQPQSTLNPATSSNPKIQYFEQKIENNKVELTYYASPYPKLSIKVINFNQFIAIQIQLTKDVLNSMDPTVLATFQTIQAMYRQFVEIVKMQPNDFQILDKGILKIKITTTMKSGTRKRDLILQASTRPLTQLQHLKHTTQQQHHQSQKIITNLTTKTIQLQNKIEQLTKQNKQLKIIIQQLKKQLKQDIKQIKQNINKQKQLTLQLINSLKSNVQWIQEGMKDIRDCMGLLMTGAKRVVLVPDMKSKCFRGGNKQNSFSVCGGKGKEGDLVKITKIGKEKWAQVLFETAIKQEISFFQIEILKTKSNYVCVGICSKNCIDEDDSKWSKQAISLFLLDKSIIIQGKQSQNKIYQQQCNYSSVLSNNSKIEEKNKIKVRVVVNCINKWIQWQSNQLLVGKAYFSEQFNNLIKSGEIRPFLICNDHDDQIIIK